MKKLGSTIVAVMIFACSAFPQTEKGTFMVGGSLSFSSRTDNDVTTNAYSLSPGVSYFFFNRFAAGINLQYSFAATGGDGVVNSRDKLLYVGPAVRYYFPIAHKWALFPQLDYTYNWQKFTSEDQGVTSVSSSSYNYTRLGAGITYFIARNVGVEGLLSARMGDFGTVLAFRVNLQVYITKSKAYE